MFKWLRRRYDVPHGVAAAWTVLRGLGATLALPFLDAMLLRFSLRGHAAAKPLHRFQAFYVLNGMAMDWLPKGGAPSSSHPFWSRAVPVRCRALGPLRELGAHPRGASGSFLTGTTRGGTNELEVFADVSMDQLLARHFARTQMGSLELSMDGPPTRGVHRQPELCLHTRSRGAARRSRCRWSTTRAWCSRSCLATAGAPIWRRGKRGCGSTRAFWIPSPRNWQTSNESSGRRIRSRSINTQRRFVMSNGAFTGPRAERARAAGTDQPQGVLPGSKIT